jgi:carbon-monoxide dehydrogenase medium subunit
MIPFTYHRPQTVAEAVDMLGGSPDARAIAGGMTLIPTLKQGLASVDRMVDLADIDALFGVEADTDRLRIRAMTRHFDVATSPVVRDRLPGLAALASGIGDFQVRNRGTIGGSVANNDPAADYPAALLALGATVVTSRREIAASDFFTGLFTTALEEGELITAVDFPIGARSAYAKFANPVSGYAMAGVFVAERDGDIRLAVTGAGPGVFRSAPHEDALRERLHPDAARSVVTPVADIISDFHAPAAYRAHLVSVMAARAVEELLA